ncbi:MAG: hypothetical protein U9N85_00490 [Bacteroidota bacterium]|nr:hypothetical protein [Bacteroidota bacterium]
MDGFACVTKKENLTNFSDKTSSGEPLVFADTNSFPGYYSNVPGKQKQHQPKFAFLVTKKTDIYHEDNILRAASKISAKADYKFWANSALIQFQNKDFHSIRVSIDDMVKIPELINELSDEGIFFERNKKVQSFDSLIKIKKYLSLSKEADSIYSGLKSNMHYIEVPKYLDWIDFENMIISTKATKEFSNFDAAMVTLFRPTGDVTEFFRIYTDKFDLSELKKLRDVFLNKFERI